MMGKVIYLLSSLQADRKGVTALEYGVIAAVLVVAVAGAMGTFGESIGSFLATIRTKIDSAVTAAG
jgi:pilus assembly protein Flp/PilA